MTKIKKAMACLIAATTMAVSMESVSVNATVITDPTYTSYTWTRTGSYTDTAGRSNTARSTGTIKEYVSTGYYYGSIKDTASSYGYFIGKHKKYLINNITTHYGYSKVTNTSSSSIQGGSSVTLYNYVSGKTLGTDTVSGLISSGGTNTSNIEVDVVLSRYKITYTASLCKGNVQQSGTRVSWNFVEDVY